MVLSFVKMDHLLARHVDLQTIQEIFTGTLTWGFVNQGTLTDSYDMFYSIPMYVRWMYADDGTTSWMTYTRAQEENKSFQAALVTRHNIWVLYCWRCQLNVCPGSVQDTSRVGGCERVFTPVRWRQVRLSCIKWRSTFFLYFFVRPSFGRQFVIRVDGCCTNCVVGLAFLPSGHTTRKQRHYDVRNDAITTSCARWVG